MAEHKQTKTVADPLEERRKIMSQHLKPGPEAESKQGAEAGRQSGRLASQQASKESMVKVTFRLPTSLHTDLERIHLAIKQASLAQPKNKKRVLLQDLLTEAVSDYVKKMERQLSKDS